MSYTEEQQAENRKNLVEAFRSGKYKQGKGAFKNAETGCFCAIGVAADLIREASDGEFEWVQTLSGMGLGKKSGIRVMTVGMLSDFYGTSSDPQSPYFNWYRLVQLNDEEGWTFEMFADGIERFA